MDSGWRLGVIDALDVVAEVAMVTGQRERAARLIAAARRERTALGLGAFPVPRGRTGRNLDAARVVPGDEDLERALRDGARLSFQEAVGYARRGRGERAGAARAGRPQPGRTSGGRARQPGPEQSGIAGKLFISRNTVKVYLSRAYGKLGVANRTELARLAARHS
jgi:regulatory LuxR family protein